MIKPTIGRQVWYWGTVEEREDNLQPQAATVCYVHGDDRVNISVLSHKGEYFFVEFAKLLQDNEKPVAPSFCEWMPYQKGQAVKNEALELAAAARAQGPTNY